MFPRYNIFSALEASKGGRLRESLRNIGEKKGRGDNGQLDFPYSANNYKERPGCDEIEQEVRKANQSLESAQSGKKIIFIRK